MPEPRSHAAHLTAPQPHDPDAQSAWPPVVGLGVVLLAVGLTVSWPLAAAAGVLVLAGLVGITREVRREAARARTRRGTDAGPADFWGRRPTQWWLALGLSLSTAMAFAAILRAFDAHALLDPASWPPVARDLDGPLPLGAALALAASAVAAQWGARALRRGKRGGLAALAAALGLAALFLGWRAAEWLALLGAGFDPRASAAASGFYALTGAHALTLALAHAHLGLTAWGASSGRLGPEGEDILRGSVLYATFVAFVGLAIHALVYLRIVTYEGRTLL